MKRTKEDNGHRKPRKPGWAKRDSDKKKGLRKHRNKRNDKRVYD